MCHGRQVRRCGAVLLLASSLAAPLAAQQDATDSVAYRALTQTPPGALPAELDVGITGQRDAGIAVQARYGIMSFDTHLYVHNFGVGVSLPVGSASMNATVGYYMPRCGVKVCHSHVTGSAGLSQNLVAIGLGRGDKTATFNVGLQGSLGFAHPSDTTLASGMLVLPLSLVPAPRGLRLVPYVSPGLGVGLVRDPSGTDAGLLFVFEGGLGLVMREVRINASVSRVFLSGGNWLAGVGVSVGGR